MTSLLKSLAVAFSLLTMLSISAAAQTTPGLSANDTANDRVATQIGMLRQSVQSLDATLSDIADKFLPLISRAKDSVAENQNRISGSLGLLTQAEQRAEMLRKQLLELIEKETSYRSHITQIEEDMRPDNIERNLNPYGTTRTTELRDARRRVLENERRGYESLLLFDQSKPPAAGRRCAAGRFPGFPIATTPDAFNRPRDRQNQSKQSIILFA